MGWHPLCSIAHCWDFRTIKAHSGDPNDYEHFVPGEYLNTCVRCGTTQFIAWEADEKKETWNLRWYDKTGDTLVQLFSLILIVALIFLLYAKI